MFKAILVGFVALFLSIGNVQSAFADSKKSTAAAPAQKKSLFERLGSQPAITAVVDSYFNTTATSLRCHLSRRLVAL